VAASVDIVLHMVRDAQGQRRVREIAAVPGRVEGDVIEMADVFVARDDTLTRADGWPPHPERFERAGFDLVDLLSPRLATAHRSDAAIA
jgi:pilus assembly protein CpaF